ncbi:MAG: sulfotransferase family protein [Gemmataceae bacterium]
MSNTPPSRPKNKGREWAPRFWEGCNLPAWVRLLAHNRFDVQPPYWYIAAIISCVSSIHSVLQFFEAAFYRHALRRTPVARPPLFILGHWRTGTTLLHELLILDPRHAFPTTYQCLEPNHFVLTDGVVPRLFNFLLPGRRPMDNMAAGWDRPQEDEFALCMLGQPSPYLTIAFPNRPPQHPEYLDLDSVPPRQREAWKAAFFGFLQKITYRNPRRLVLKSPPHTARIPILLEMFPEAQFVHISRNPYVVFPSTVNLWKSLYRKHGLQTPTFGGLEEQVFATFVRMSEKYEAGKKQIDPSRLHELRYEDLVRDPLAEMQRLYEKLNLGSFDAAKPRIQQYLERNKNYETNKYDLSPDLRAEVARRWGDYIRKWGYESA